MQRIAFPLILLLVIFGFVYNLSAGPVSPKAVTPVKPISINADDIIFSGMTANGQFCKDLDNESITGDLKVGGLNYYIGKASNHKTKGTTYYFYNSAGKNSPRPNYVKKKFTDICQKEGGSYLFEYHCNGYNPNTMSNGMFSLVYCPKGYSCKGGACMFGDVDKCPDVEGLQKEFLFDNDSIPGKESCFPAFIGKKTFCANFDPKNDYPDSTLYNYGEKWHLGYCASDKEILYLSCTDKGELKADIVKCEGEYSCQLGACYPCIDSDGPLNFKKVGSVSYTDKNGTIVNQPDDCGFYNVKIDFYCNGYYPQMATEYCPPGYVCKIYGNNSDQMGCFKASQPTCNDPDGKDNFETIDSVSGIDELGKEYTIQDSCYEMKMRDYYCFDNKSYFKKTPCPDNLVCKENYNTMKLECIPPVKPTCEETDKGLDFNKFGILKFMTANGTAGTKTDRCNYNNSAVIEMYCKDDGTYGSDEVACDAGMICKEIKDDTGQTIWVGCVKEGECVDTDPQNETNQPGIVYDFKNPPYYDKCLGSTVIECICDPNTKQKNELPPFTCPNGCEGGACK